MEIALAKRSSPLLHLLRFWYNANVGNSCRKKSDTLEINKVELEHRVYGETAGNIPLIILHDLLGRKEDWEYLANQIRYHQKYKRSVINVDLRNHGQSPYAPTHGYLEMAADVKNLMDKLKIKEAALMGHGMGARAAMVLAIAEPAKVANLIVVDSSPVTVPKSYHEFYPPLLDLMKAIKFDKMTSVIMARRLVYYKFQYWDANLDFGTLLCVLNNVVEKEGRVTWLSNLDIIRKDFKKLQSFPHEVAGKIFEGSSLFIGGCESDFIPSEDCESINFMFPSSSIEYVKEAGHNLQKENPDYFLSLVNDFLPKCTTEK